MSELLRKVQGNRHAFHCPGCGYSHVINNSWQISFNGDLPTVSPSILTHGGPNNITCHLFIKNGEIQFLNDCTHKLAGKIIKMQEEYK
jgi:hypothetical protein